MEHHFNIVLAQEYGIEESILIHNLYYWIHKNACNNKHCHEERYWTYNTTKAFASLFPYMNETKIFRSLKKLEECGFIIKGNFNEMKTDRTCWYAFSDFAIERLITLGYDAFHFVKTKNGNLQNEITIPNNNIDNNNKEKEEDKSSSQKKQCVDYQAIFNTWNEVVANIEGISTITKMSEKRKKYISALIKSCDTNVEEILRVIKTLPYADHWVTSKKAESEWSFSFDWFFTNTKNWFIRALEGDMHKRNAKIFEQIMNGEEATPQPTESKGEVIINGTKYR